MTTQCGLKVSSLACVALVHHDAMGPKRGHFDANYLDMAAKEVSMVCLASGQLNLSCKGTGCDNKMAVRFLYGMSYLGAACEWSVGHWRRGCRNIVHYASGYNDISDNMLYLHHKT